MIYTFRKMIKYLLDCLGANRCVLQTMLIIMFMGFGIIKLWKWKFSPAKQTNIIPLSVNFHFTRKCNYKCKFCFHTEKTSHLTAMDEAKRGLHLLAVAGMRKINFSGGEPFLYPQYLGELVIFCKQALRLESVSIVSNGSKITKQWFEDYADYLDILAISVDSFDESTNIKIGRGKGRHLEKMTKISGWCEEYGIKFKLNTVVCVHNWQEDMIQAITCLAPFRWKVFQCLLVDSENAGDQAVRQAKDLLITDQQFQDFVARHRSLQCLVPESNLLMKSSYLILDEYMRFLNKGDKYAESESILTVGVERALRQVDFEEATFNDRGGVYDWTKMSHLMPEQTEGEGGGCGQSLPSHLQF